MPAIVLPPPSELPHEGGQILKFPIIKETPLDDGSSTILTVVIKEICLFCQPLELKIGLLANSLGYYAEDNFLCVEVTVLGALAYYAFAPPDFALFYMKVLYPALPPGFPDPCKFLNAQYHEQNQPNPFFHFSFLPTLPSSLLAVGGAELD
jgi:hypothetical protein